MAQFASIDDLATLTSLDPSEEAAADMLLTAATAAIQRFTGQQIALVTDDEAVLAGTWARELVLPQWPVVEVNALTLNGAAIPAGTWLFAGRTLYRGNLPIFNGPDDWGGDLLLTAWGGPMARVGVTYTHGFTVVPADVQLICIQAALRTLRNPDGAESSETIGNYAYSGASTAGVALTDDEKAALKAYDPTI